MGITGVNPFKDVPNPFEALHDTASNAGKQLGFGDQGQNSDVAQMNAAYTPYKNSIQQSMNQQEGADTDYTQGVTKAASNYEQARNGALSPYYAQINNATTQNNAAINDVKNTYTNTTQPGLKSIVDQTGKNAGSAMSLADSMDPNNAVHKANEAKFNQLASNANNSGLASVGIMQAMGAQSLGQQLSGAGVPMTGGQMQALMGTNMSQAGSAMANVQNQVQKLRDQGVQMGYDQSDLAYNNGQKAIGSYSSALGNYAGAQNTALGEENKYQTQNTGLASTMANSKANTASQDFGINSGILGMQKGDSYNQAGRVSSMAGMDYNHATGVAQQQLAKDNASQAGKLGVLSSVLNIGGGIAGNAMGGPLGGGAMGGIGSAITGAGASPYNNTMGGQRGGGGGGGGINFNFGGGNNSNPEEETDFSDYDGVGGG